MDFKIPYGRQSIDEKDIEAVVNTLKGDFLTQGPKIQEFEKKFAESVNAKYAVAVSNATAGLHIGVKVLNNSSSLRVITSPNTFAASANCVRYNSGEVWLSDICPDSFLMDIEKLEELILSKPKGFFNGIIPVNFAGLSVDMEQFNNLAKRHNLWIIEDAAHSPGAYFIDTEGNKVFSGSCVYNDISVFSFHPVKHIACGEGGMITTNSEEMYEKLLLYRSHGITKSNMSENPGNWYYEMQDLGFNYRLTDMQAALGITQLSKNNEFGLMQRNKIANKYKRELKGLFKFQEFKNKKFFNAYHLFVILSKNRKELYEYLRENGVYAQIHYIPVHKLPYYSGIGYNEANLENCDHYYEHCISLPMFPSLSEKEQDYVIECLKSF